MTEGALIGLNWKHILATAINILPTPGQGLVAHLQE